MKKTIALLFLSMCLILSFSPAFAGQPTAADSVKKVAVKQAKVNINKADQVQLVTLPGIGEKTAESIISHRGTNGNFTKVEDLMNVKGIGEKKFEKLKSYITI